MKTKKQSEPLNKRGFCFKCEKNRLFKVVGKEYVCNNCETKSKELYRSIE